MSKVSVRLFIAGLVSAIGISAIASVPRHSGSVAIDEEVSEIRTRRHQELHADSDIARLSQLQGRYRENIILLKRKAGPAKRTAKAPDRRRLQPVGYRSNLRTMQSAPQRPASRTVQGQSRVIKRSVRR